MLTSTDCALLGLLAIRPMSGYQLKKFAEGSIGHFWSESYGQIYPALARLETGGCIAEQKVLRNAAPVKKTRPQKVFALTETGREALLHWLPGPTRQQPPRNEMLLKIFFGSNAPVKLSRELLRNFARTRETALQTYLAIDQQLKMKDGAQAQFCRMTLQLGIMTARTDLAWCAECEQTLNSIKKARKAARRAQGE